MNSIKIPENSKLLGRLVFVVLITTVLVILGGAFVRATGSGAGCGEHWPLCKGQAIPVNPTIETAIEFSHRFSSGLSLVLFGISFLWIRKKYPKGAAIRVWANIACASFFFEASIGAMLVLKRLVTTDASTLRGIVIALHLVNTQVLLAGLMGMLWCLWAKPIALRSLNCRSLWILGGWGVVGALGAIVALSDTLFPATSLAHGIRQDFAHDAHFLVRLRILHPFLAIIVSIITFIDTLESDKKRLFSGSLRAVLIAQLLCGISNWIFLAPIGLQLLHLLLADLLWLSLVAYMLEGASSDTLSYASLGNRAWLPISQEE